MAAKYRTDVMMPYRQLKFPFDREVCITPAADMGVPAYEQEEIAPFMPGVLTRREADEIQRRRTAPWPKFRAGRSRKRSESGKESR